MSICKVGHLVYPVTNRNSVDIDREYKYPQILCPLLEAHTPNLFPKLPCQQASNLTPPKCLATWLNHQQCTGISEIFVWGCVFLNKWINIPYWSTGNFLFSTLWISLRRNNTRTIHFEWISTCHKEFCKAISIPLHHSPCSHRYRQKETWHWSRYAHSFHGLLLSFTSVVGIYVATTSFNTCLYLQNTASVAELTARLAMMGSLNCMIMICTVTRGLVYPSSKVKKNWKNTKNKAYRNVEHH